MKKILTKTVSPKEIKKFCFCPQINRCFTRDFELAKEYGFGEKDVKNFCRRVNTLKREIIKNGWTPLSVIMIGVINGKRYIIEGQGRCVAIGELFDEGKIDNGIKIYADFWEFESFEEARAVIESLNKARKNWSSNDIFEVEMKSRGKEGLEIIENINKLTGDLGVTEGIARYLLYGLDATRINNTKENVYDERLKYSEQIIDFMYAAHSAFDENNWKQKEIKRVFTFNGCEAFYCMVSRMINKYGIDGYDRLKKRFIEIASTLSDNDVRRMFVGKKRDEIRANVIDRLMLKLPRKNNLREMLGDIR